MGRKSRSNNLLCLNNSIQTGLVSNTPITKKQQPIQVNRLRIVSDKNQEKSLAGPTGTIPVGLSAFIE